MAGSTKKTTASSQVASADAGLGGLLAPGSDFAQILHNQNSGQYAFWKTADSNLPAVQSGTGYSLWNFINDAVDNGWISATDPTNFELNLKKTENYQAGELK